MNHGLKENSRSENMLICICSVVSTHRNVKTTLQGRNVWAITGTKKAGPSDPALKSLETPFASDIRSI
jgi:hypothetical protein